MMGGWGIEKEACLLEAGVRGEWPFAPYARNLTSPAPAFAQTTPQRYASAIGTARFSKS